MLIDQHKLLFVHIPKTGGTTIRDLLLRFLLKLDVARLTDSDIDRTYGYKHYRYIDYVNYYCYQIKNYNKDYFSFSFVRNPWDRVVSAYHYMKQCKEKDRYKNIIKLNINDFLMRLEEFYLNIELLMPQSDFITNNQEILVDCVGRYEFFSDDVFQIFDKYKLKCVALPNINKTRHSHYSDYYSIETKAIVKKLYERDIDFFYYTFEQKNS